MKDDKHDNQLGNSKDSSYFPQVKKIVSEPSNLQGKKIKFLFHKN